MAKNDVTTLEPPCIVVNSIRKKKNQIKRFCAILLSIKLSNFAIFVFLYSTQKYVFLVKLPLFNDESHIFLFEHLLFYDFISFLLMSLFKDHSSFFFLDVEKLKEFWGIINHIIMKNLIQFTTALFLLVQTIGYSQTKNTKTISEKQDTTLKKQNKETKISTKNLKKFIGKYILEEANFTVEIVQEKDKMYIITEFSKDLLTLKNETTLQELTRGVDLELIKNNKDALKFGQNGYEAIIKRVNSKKK